MANGPGRAGASAGNALVGSFRGTCRLARRPGAENRIETLEKRSGAELDEEAANVLGRAEQIGIIRDEMERQQDDLGGIHALLEGVEIPVGAQEADHRLRASAIDGRHRGASHAPERLADQS